MPANQSTPGVTRALSHADWLHIAKTAGKYGVRYETNSRLEAFLAEVSATPARGGDELREALHSAIHRARHEWVCTHGVNGKGVDDAICDAVMAALASTDMAGAGEKCALPPKGWSCTRTPGHDGPCAAVPNDNSLEDEIAEALTDSLDMDWTSSVGARHVMALLREKGIVS